MCAQCDDFFIMSIHSSIRCVCVGRCCCSNDHTIRSGFDSLFYGDGGGRFSGNKCITIFFGQTTATTIMTIRTTSVLKAIIFIILIMYSFFSLVLFASWTSMRFHLMKQVSNKHIAYRYKFLKAPRRAWTSRQCFHAYQGWMYFKSSMKLFKVTYILSHSAHDDSRLVSEATARHKDWVNRECFASLFFAAAAASVAAAAYITFCFFQFNSNKKKHISIQPTQPALCHSMRFVVCVLLVVWHRIAQAQAQFLFCIRLRRDSPNEFENRCGAFLDAFYHDNENDNGLKLWRCQWEKKQNTYPFHLHYILLPHTWRWLAGLRLSWRPEGINH